LGLKKIKDFSGTVKRIGFDNGIVLGIGFKKINTEFSDMIASYIETTSE